MEEKTSTKNSSSTRLPKSLTTITTFSKALAMFLFILFPFVGFYLGFQYSASLNQTENMQKIIKNRPQNTTPTPTCRPRPACLDATPRCMIPETSDMCPRTIVPSQ